MKRLPLDSISRGVRVCSRVPRSALALSQYSRSREVNVYATQTLEDVQESQQGVEVPDADKIETSLDIIPPRCDPLV